MRNDFAELRGELPPWDASEFLLCLPQSASLIERSKDDHHLRQPFARAHVSLLSAPDDPWIASGTLQLAFGKFRRFLFISGIENATPMFYQDSDPAAEGSSGEFIIPLTQAGRPPIATASWLQEFCRCGEGVIDGCGEPSLKNITGAILNWQSGARSSPHVDRNTPPSAMFEVNGPRPSW